MRMSRRAVLHGAGSGKRVTFSYSGAHDLFGDNLKGFAVLKGNGILTIKGTVDFCLVGGGGKGSSGSSSSDDGGGGGAGGYLSNYLAQALSGNLNVNIGAGAVTAIPGGTTTVGASYSAIGGNSSTSASGATGRGKGGYGRIGGVGNRDGEDGIFPWDDAVNFASYRVSGCGGAGKPQTSGAGSGGLGGGGNGGESGDGADGAANKGAGGGGGRYGTSGNHGGSGGSGVVFVCWGYTH